MEEQEATNATVAGEGSETYGSMIGREGIQGPRTKETSKLVKAAAVREVRENVPVAMGQIAAGEVIVPERVPGPIDPASQVPNEPTLEEKLEDAGAALPDNTLPGDLPPPSEEIPPAVADAVLTSLEPAELSVSAPDTTVLVKGENFTEESVIVWNNGDEPTTFGDPTSLSTMVKPSTVDPGVPLPFSVPVKVRTGEKETAELPFTFVAAQ